jgi:hypothetical protein
MYFESKAVKNEIFEMQCNEPINKKANYFGKLKSFIYICIAILTFKNI